MRFMDPPTLDSPARGRSGDELDGLLRAFFHAEMPNPWPGAPVVEEAPAVLSRPMSARPSRSLFRSRMALAASVAFLLGIPWLISDSFRSLMPDDSGVVSFEKSAATRIRLSAPTLEQRPDGTVIRIIGEEIPVDSNQKVKNQIKDMLP